MKNVRFLRVLLLYSCSIVTVFPQDSTKFCSKADYLNTLGERILKEGTILGFSVAIDSAGTTNYSGAFGYTDAEKTRPVTEETRFDIASISKLIGVNVIMKLAEQGKISLEQTLEELLPVFPENEQAGKIKLKHLLSHTSGLQDYTLKFGSEFITKEEKPGMYEYLEFFRGKELVFEPGSRYQYNNSGFLLMAYIAENSTGKTWQELINEVINEPTGLDFQLIRYVANSPRFSPIFDYGDDEIQIPIEGFKKGQFNQIPLWDYVIGDGGLTASSKMLAKFPNFWADGKIIPYDSYKSMTSPKTLDNGAKAGYGLGVRNGEFFGEKIIGHTGGWRSTYAILAYFPERKLTFAGLMNTDGTPTQMPFIFSTFMAFFLGKSVPDYKTNPTGFENPGQLVGNYQGYSGQFDTEGETVTIELKNNQLNYCINGYCEPIYYMGENKFWLESYPYDFIEFETNDQGQAIVVREYYYGFFQVFREKVLKNSKQ